MFLVKVFLLKGNGMFLSYCGIETIDEGKSWLINGIDISKSGLKYNVATNVYTKENTKLNDSRVIVLHLFNLTETESLINYLKKSLSTLLIESVLFY